MLRTRERSHRYLLSLSAWIFFSCISFSNAEKIRYVSDTECDRYSLDAVYNDKFKPITENIFKDVIAFANKVSDSVADSLTSAMATLPDRDSSNEAEKRVYDQFNTIKKSFRSKINKEHKNITAKWNDLVACSFELLYDSGKTSLKEYLNKTLDMTDAYKEARNSLDLTMGAFINYVKNTISGGLQGISRAASDALKKEAQAKKNTTEEEEKKEETPEEQLKNKKVEITEMVVSGFLRNITVKVIKENIDLFKIIAIKPEKRDSVLDDILFDLLMIKNRIMSIIHDDIPKEKGSIDLARRSIFMYWTGQAETMYKEKLKSKQSTSSSSEEYYEKLWSDEKTLMNTLLNLMDVYP